MLHFLASAGGHTGRIAAIVLATAFLGACASTGTAVYTPQPFPKAGTRGGTATPAPAAPAGPVAANPPADPGVVPPTTRPTPMEPGRGTADGYALSGVALSLRGAPYRDGGDTPSGFDCSGFVKYVYEQNGVAMPRQVRDQYKLGTSVSRDYLAPGDLVFFSTVAPGASHVGIMIGGDQFVHAPSERGVVRVESLSQDYWARRFIGARRVS